MHRIHLNATSPWHYEVLMRAITCRLHDKSVKALIGAAETSLLDRRSARRMRVLRAVKV
jgi:hypothetical protein